MGTTVNRLYPYPSPNDDPDVPYWLQRLAEAIDGDVDFINDALNADTGWITATLAAGFTHNTSSGWTGVKYRKVRNVVFLTGAVAASSWVDGVTVLTLPGAYRPSVKIAGMGAEVYPGGTVSLPKGTVATSFAVSFPV